MTGSQELDGLLPASPQPVLLSFDKSSSRRTDVNQKGLFSDLRAGPEVPGVDALVAETAVLSLQMQPRSDEETRQQQPPEPLLQQQVIKQQLLLQQQLLLLKQQQQQFVQRAHWGSSSGSFGGDVDETRLRWRAQVAHSELAPTPAARIGTAAAATTAGGAAEDDGVPSCDGPALLALHSHMRRGGRPRNQQQQHEQQQQAGQLERPAFSGRISSPRVTSGPSTTICRHQHQNQQQQTHQQQQAQQQLQPHCAGRCESSPRNGRRSVPIERRESGPRTSSSISSISSSDNSFPTAAAPVPLAVLTTWAATSAGLPFSTVQTPQPSARVRISEFSLSPPRKKMHITALRESRGHTQKPTAAVGVETSGGVNCYRQIVEAPSPCQQQLQQQGCISSSSSSSSKASRTAAAGGAECPYSPRMAKQQRGTGSSLGSVRVQQQQRRSGCQIRQQLHEPSLHQAAATPLESLNFFQERANNCHLLEQQQQQQQQQQHRPHEQQQQRRHHRIDPQQHKARQRQQRYLKQQRSHAEPPGATAAQCCVSGPIVLPPGSPVGQPDVPVHSRGSSASAAERPPAAALYLVQRALQRAPKRHNAGRRHQQRQQQQQQQQLRLPPRSFLSRRQQQQQQQELLHPYTSGDEGESAAFSGLVAAAAEGAAPAGGAPVNGVDNVQPPFTLMPLANVMSRSFPQMPQQMQQLQEQRIMTLHQHQRQQQQQRQSQQADEKILFLRPCCAHIPATRELPGVFETAAAALPRLSSLVAPTAAKSLSPAAEPATAASLATSKSPSPFVFSWSSLPEGVQLTICYFLGDAELRCLLAAGSASRAAADHPLCWLQRLARRMAPCLASTVERTKAAAAALVLKHSSVSKHKWGIEEQQRLCSRTAAAAAPAAAAGEKVKGEATEVCENGSSSSTSLHAALWASWAQHSLNAGAYGYNYKALYRDRNGWKSPLKNTKWIRTKRQANPPFNNTMDARQQFGLLYAASEGIACSGRPPLAQLHVLSLHDLTVQRKALVASKAVNCLDVNEELLVCGDDNGVVQLYNPFSLQLHERYPATGGFSLPAGYPLSASQEINDLRICSAEKQILAVRTTSRYPAGLELIDIPTGGRKLVPPEKTSGHWIHAVDVEPRATRCPYTSRSGAGFFPGCCCGGGSRSAHRSSSISNVFAVGESSSAGAFALLRLDFRQEQPVVQKLPQSKRMLWPLRVEGHRAFVNLVYGAGDFTGRIQEIDMRMARAHSPNSAFLSSLSPSVFSDTTIICPFGLQHLLPQKRVEDLRIFDEQLYVLTNDKDGELSIVRFGSTSSGRAEVVAPVDMFEAAEWAEPLRLLLVYEQGWTATYGNYVTVGELASPFSPESAGELTVVLPPLCSKLEESFLI